MTALMRRSDPGPQPTPCHSQGGQHRANPGVWLGGGGGHGLVKEGAMGGEGTP